MCIGGGTCLVLLMSIFVLNDRLRPHWGRQRQAPVATLDMGRNVGGVAVPPGHCQR